MKVKTPKLDEWIPLLEKHLERRLLMEPRDIYKLLYQGILGPEHLVTSPSAFAERLRVECEALTPNRDDPLLEAIHPQDRLLRLNLRPFKAAGLDITLLVEACLQTAGLTWGTPHDLRSLWESFARSYHRRPLAGFTNGEIEDFTAWLASHNYPAVHHSQAYSQAYQPAYRLLAADLAVHFRELQP